MKNLLFPLLFLICSQVVASHDKYRLTLRDDPATTIVIGWNQISGNNAKVFYGNIDFGTDYNKYPNAKAPDRSVSYRDMNNNFVRLTGLQPNTAYYFVVKDNQEISRRFWFRTAPSDKSRLSFIAGGDSRNNRTPRRNANLLVAKLKPNAVLFGGDMTDDDSNSQWNSWFDDWQLTIATDGRMFPVIATRGNHEDSNKSIYNLFDTPSSNIYYALTFGDNLIRTYTLNTEISISGNQTSWLRNDLDAYKNVLWKIAQYHKPMRPHVRYKSEGNNQYNNWARLFYDKGVQLVVECDAHTVKTTWPVRPDTGSGTDEGFIQDTKNGTVYVGEGCWGAPLRGNNDTKNWTRNSASFNQFKWIFVDENKIETRTIKVDNASQVREVSNINVFEIPNNLDVWSPSNGSVVTINRRFVTDPDPENSVVELAIANGNDDVEEDKDGKIYDESSDLELIYDSYNNSSYQVIGLRFQSVNLPENVTIKSAYLQFTADESNTTDTSLEISLHNSFNSPSFSDANNVSGRNTYVEKVHWNPSPWIVDQSGSSQRSPNLKALVQRLVNTSGWTSGNSLSFCIRGTGNSLINTSAKRVAESYEGGAGVAPRLIITYSIKNTTTSICDKIDPWKNGINYQLGQKITYNGVLYERASESWERIGSCDMDKSFKKNIDASAPPIQNFQKEFLITPIPFNSEIQISTENFIKNQNFTVSINNLAGKLLYKKPISTATNMVKIYPEINAQGIYLLSIIDVTNNDVIYIKKVVKQ